MKRKSRERPRRRKEFEDLPPSPYAPHFIEKMLLSIIEAYPVSAEILGVSQSAKLSEIRLDRAMQALFGVESIPVSNNDLPTLMVAARSHLPSEQQRLFERLVLKVSPSQKRIAFSSAVGLVGSTQTDDEDRKDYIRLKKKYELATYADYLHHLVTFHYHEEEAAMESDLGLMAEILARWLIDVDLTPEKLGLLSKTHFQTSS